MIKEGNRVELETDWTTTFGEIEVKFPSGTAGRVAFVDESDAGVVFDGLPENRALVPKSFLKRLYSSEDRQYAIHLAIENAVEPEYQERFIQHLNDVHQEEENAPLDVLHDEIHHEKIQLELFSAIVFDSKHGGLSELDQV